jgi:magnesium-transporting ATPase (P-type)
LLRAFRNPFIVVLLVLAGVQLATGGNDYTGPLIIAAMVGISVLLGFTQEYGSSRAAEQLKTMVRNTVTVRRRASDGHSEQIEAPVRELVVGDIVQLAAGDIGRFMVWIGPVSLIFGITTFWLMWRVFGANTSAQQSLFHSGWFIEGLLSQTLIVHMIRTRRVPFLHSVASAPVLGLTIAVIVLGMLLPFSTLGSKIGMVPLPPMYFAWLALTLVSYCVLTQLMKLIYIRRYGRWL